MNKLLEGLKNASNYTYTENGAITHKTTNSALLDMFAMGGAYRKRPEEDCLLLFKEAYTENPEYALKCLFYLRDIRGNGQGERRFFRVCMKWLANYNPEAVKRNLPYFAEMGRWDDLYCLVGTMVEKDMFALIKKQLTEDLRSTTPSLASKWLPSINASSKETKRLGNLTRNYLGLSPREYRKMLSCLRERIRIVERLMSENRWEEIDFSKLPSKAGLLYRNAFERREEIAEKYKEFARDKSSTVNAGTLYPYEVVEKAIDLIGSSRWLKSSVTLDDTQRLMINKYWDNMKDYFEGSKLNALCMVDTSASMNGTPIDVAISLGLYCAERAKGPFTNHYISFSREPRLVECKGVDFCDKVHRIVSANLCENTNIEKAFDMVLKTAIQNHVAQKDLPEHIIVISDMEFDQGTCDRKDADTLMEGICRKWEAMGYRMPNLVFWNVDARNKNGNIPMLGSRVSFVSGFSPAAFKIISSGKTGEELMWEALNDERYANIH